MYGPRISGTCLLFIPCWVVGTTTLRVTTNSLGAEGVEISIPYSACGKTDPFASGYQRFLCTDCAGTRRSHASQAPDMRCYKAGSSSPSSLHQIVQFHLHNCVQIYFLAPSDIFIAPDPLHRQKQTRNKMCSVYIFLYDCGCCLREGGEVPCAKKGTPFCHGIREHFRRRHGFNCVNHGG